MPDRMNHTIHQATMLSPYFKSRMICKIHVSSGEMGSQPPHNGNGQGPPNHGNGQAPQDKGGQQGPPSRGGPPPRR